MLKAVIFDMDGVLIDSETIHFEANKKVLADMGKELGYDYYRQFIGGTLTGMWEVMQKDGMVASDLTIDELNGLSYAATNALLEANGGYPPVKGACELVKELRKSDMKMAIASSSMYERIERTAKSLGVDDCFDVYVSGEQLKRPKPAPDIFIKAAELLGVSPSECIVIEDSGNGVNAAKAAGMACVGYINPGSGDQDLSAADYLVESLEGLETSFFNMVHAHCNGEPWTAITTDRLILREITVEDVDALYRIYRDEEIKKYVEPLYENRQEEIEFTRAYIENAYKFFGYGIWIMETHDGNVIGRAGLSNREYNGETIVEVGYLLDGQYRNKGYASEALNAVMDYGWNELELSSLYCFIRPDNTHSIKFARKHGFVYEGRAVSEDMEFSVYKRKKPE